MYVCTTSAASFLVFASQNRLSADYTRFFFPARDSITGRAAKNSSSVPFDLDRSLVNGLATNATACIRISFILLGH